MNLSARPEQRSPPHDTAANLVVRGRDRANVSG